MPVLYSPLIANTARMATTAWPRSIPVRLILAGSRSQLADGHVVAAAAAALTAMVSVMVPSSSQLVSDTVRSLVHSACSASRMLVGYGYGYGYGYGLMCPSGAAGRRLGRG
jgi:hypothetical protein